VISIYIWKGVERGISLVPKYLLTSTKVQILTPVASTKVQMLTPVGKGHAQDVFHASTKVQILTPVASTKVQILTPVGKGHAQDVFHDGECRRVVRGIRYHYPF
jgi:hypothetical protein